MQGACRKAAICFVFIILALWVTWPLVGHLDEALPGDLGDPLLNAWILGWDADRLRHGLAGLWDAPIFFPYRHTLAFSEHLLGIAVPVAPIIWLTGRPLIAYNVAFVAAFSLAGIGMWLLVRRLTGRDDAGVVAGAIFAFAPARFGHIGHLQVLMSGWMPLALLALHRYIESGSRRALAAFTAAFLIQGLSNSYFIYFLAVPSAVVAVYGLATHRDRRWRLVLGFVLSAALIVVVFAPIATAYFEVRHSYGLRRTEGEVTAFGADLGSYLHGNEALGPPIRIWRALPHFDKPAGPEGEVFPGMIALLLACAGLWPWFRRKPDANFPALYAAITGAALLLSFGAQPTAWGLPLPIGAAYRWLFFHLPGFDGMRVPARFSVVVLLGVAVLAGAGFARLSRDWVNGARLAAAVAVTSFVLLEGAAGPMPLAFLKPHGFPDRAAYSWIRDQEAGALLELPAGELDAGLRSYQYEYQTLVHRHPIVNGASGYESALQTFLGSAASPLVEADHFGDALQMLRSIGIRTVVVHPQWFGASSTATALLGLFRRHPDQVRSEATFPGVSVFRLADWSAGPTADTDATEVAHRSQTMIPTSAFQAASSHASDRLSRAFDGDIRTRWLSGRHQAGDEWIDVRFDRPRDVARLRILTNGRSVGDYPRELVVEVFEGTESPRGLYRGTVISALAHGLIADPERGPIDIWLPVNRATRLRLRQVGQTPVWFWSIDELTFWER